MEKAASKGIPLEDYLQDHPEPLVHRMLDLGQLRYAWTDPDGNRPSSDDGGPQPPKGWWPRPIWTTIDREKREVRGDARVKPHFPPMYFVVVFPEPAVTEQPAQRHIGRPSSAALVVEEAARRLRSTNSAALLRQGRDRFLGGLSEWLGKAHPEKPQMAAKTIGVRLRENEVVRGLMPKSWLRK